MSAINYKKASGLVFADLLTILFIALKLTNNIDWGWLWVLAPFWGSLLFVSIVRGVERYKTREAKNAEPSTGRNRFKLRAYWSALENDFMIDYPLGRQSKLDASYLSDFFNKQLASELKGRGYDIEQLKFEIPIKVGARPEKFKTLHEELGH